MVMSTAPGCNAAVSERAGNCYTGTGTDTAVPLLNNDPQPHLKILHWSSKADNGMFNRHPVTVRTRSGYWYCTGTGTEHDTLAADSQCKTKCPQPRLPALGGSLGLQAPV